LAATRFARSTSPIVAPPGKGNQPRSRDSPKIVTGKKSENGTFATQELKYSALTSGRFFSSWARVPTNSRNTAAKNMVTVIRNEPAA